MSTMSVDKTFARGMSIMVRDESLLVDTESFSIRPKSIFIADGESFGDEDFTSYQLSSLMEEISRKRQIIANIKTNCTEDNIRKKYMYTEVTGKQIKYDPKLYSVMATESLAIHEKLKKLFGTDVIELQNPEFTEASLKVMLEAEEKEEHEATEARKKRGEDASWNVKKIEIISDISNMLERTQCSFDKPVIQTAAKKKNIPHCRRPMLYDHRLHSFDVPESKYQIAGRIWDDDDNDDDDDLLKADQISLLFEEADDLVATSHLPKQNLVMKKCNQELEILVDQNSNNAKRKIKTEKVGNCKNNPAKEKPQMESEEKWRKLMKPTPRQQRKTKSNYSILEATPEQEAQTALRKEMEDDDDDVNSYEPQRVRPEEKEIDEPSLNINQQ